MKENQKKDFIKRKENPTFFDMFSKLGLLIKEKQSRKTSAPL